MKALFVFLVLALPAAALAQTTHIVNQSSLSFLPDDITIEVGDTVRWVYGGGSHTVTSGTGTGDPNVGNLFDAPLNSSNTTFEFTFTNAGDFDYFCRPHVNFGMTGMVRVNEVSAVGAVPAAPVVLQTPWPNPFNPRTEVRFTLAEAGLVDLAVFDARGRLVKTLIRTDHRTAAEHRIDWDGTDDTGFAVPSGTYLFRVRAEHHHQVVKGMLVR